MKKNIKDSEDYTRGYYDGYREGYNEALKQSGIQKVLETLTRPYLTIKDVQEIVRGD